MFAKLARGLPIKRLEADTAPIKTLNGGNLWQLPSGWAIFVAHTKGASALLDTTGKVRLRGAWMGSGRFPDGFCGTFVTFGDKTARRESLLRQSGVDFVHDLPF